MRLNEVDYIKIEDFLTSKKAQEDDSIKFLMSISSAIPEGQNLDTYFEDLYKIDEIKPIIDVIKFGQHKFLGVQIIFHLGQENLYEILGSDYIDSDGLVRHFNGKIYVAGKDRKDILGALAHELTHLTMQILYGNECKPYLANEKEKIESFERIIKEIEKKKTDNIIDNIIKWCYENYEEKEDWPCELIVHDQFRHI
jgi:hypothetical protein